MPTVSVIIPTYKRRDLVLETLASVFAQTFTDYEVIVVNDGSPDDTAEVLRPLAESGRIRYLEQANGGQARARNRGIGEARGEFIALLDDDDLWPPDKLEWQVEALRRHPEAGLIAGPAVVIDAEGRPQSRTGFRPEILFEESFSGTPIVSPGQTLIRADVLRRVNGLNPDIWGAEDWDLWLRILKSSRVLMEDRDALLYRRHEGTVSTNVCRMLDNLLRVVHLHLANVAAGERGRVRRQSYRWLYNYLGKQIVWRMKREVKSGDVRRVPAYLARLAKLGRVIITDPVALKRGLGGLRPARRGRGAS